MLADGPWCLCVESWMAARPELCGDTAELAVIVANETRAVSDDVLVQTASRHRSVSVASGSAS